MAWRRRRVPDADANTRPIVIHFMTIDDRFKINTIIYSENIVHAVSMYSR